MTVDLVSWLLEQVAQDERVAGAVQDRSHPWDGQWVSDGGRAVRTYNGWVLAYPNDAGKLPEGFAEHVAEFDPARVLAECAAKRRIVEHVQAAITGWIEDQPEPGDIGYDKHDRSETDCAVSDLEHVLRLLALPYVTRPGYREEWKP